MYYESTIFLAVKSPILQMFSSVALNIGALMGAFVASIQYQVCIRVWPYATPMSLGCGSARFGRHRPGNDE